MLYRIIICLLYFSDLLLLDADVEEVAFLIVGDPVGQVFLHSKFKCLSHLYILVILQCLEYFDLSMQDIYLMLGN